MSAAAAWALQLSLDDPGHSSKGLIGGSLGVIFFPIAVILGGAQVIFPPRLLLSDAWLRYEGPFWRLAIDWREVEPFFVGGARSTTWASYRFLPGRARRGILSGLTRIATAGKSDGALSGQWPMPTIDLVEILNDYRGRALAGQSGLTSGVT
jgi:hypothetical protein